VRHCAEEDRCVPELEFGSREQTVKGIDYKGSNCTQYKSERQAMVDVLLKQAAWSLSQG
jgi:hypothetical protein